MCSLLGHRKECDDRRYLRARELAKEREGERRGGGVKMKKRP